MSEQPTGMARLGRDALVYWVGIVLSRAASFVMLPIYTRYLSPADYGTLEMLVIAVEITTILVSAGTVSGFLRFYFKAESEEDRHALVSTAFFLLSGLNALGALVLVVAAPWIASSVLGGADEAIFVRIASASFVFEAFVTVPMLLLQARQASVPYTLVAFGKLLLQLSLNILLVVVLEQGVQGVLLGNLGARAAVGCALVFWMFRETGIRISREAVGDLRRFGVPYQFVTAGAFILTFGDRLFLRGSHGLTEVGLYALAYKFGFLLQQGGAQPFLRAWNPQRFTLADAPKAERDQEYNRGCYYFSIILTSIAVALAVFAPPVLVVMADPKFHPAVDLVPLIVLAYLMFAWTDVIKLGIDVSEKTKYATIATWITVAFVLVAYTVLVIPLGGLGAALATILAFGLRLGLFYRFSQQLWPVDYEWSPHVRIVGLGVLVCSAFYLLKSDILLYQTAQASVAFAVYLLVLWFGVLGKDQRRTLGGFVQSFSLGHLRQSLANR